MWHTQVLGLVATLTTGLQPMSHKSDALLNALEALSHITAEMHLQEEFDLVAHHLPEDSHVKQAHTLTQVQVEGLSGIPDDSIAAFRNSMGVKRQLYHDARVTLRGSIRMSRLSEGEAADEFHEARPLVTGAWRADCGCGWIG